MNHVVQYSAGLSSWRAAVRVAAEHGTDNLRLLFTDTLAEDWDAYRFLIESAAGIFDVTSLASQSLSRGARDLPPEREDKLESRKGYLGAMRKDAARLIPGLVWIADGRTPWEVFFAERFMGNSRVDPCSKILKRQLADRWRKENCDPAATTIYLGYGYDEQDRIERFRKRLSGWRVEFPMDRPPYMNRVALMHACRESGMEVPRLYLMGMKHNNCGGRCVKSGQAGWSRTLEYLPDLYAYDERQEQRFRESVKIDSSILTDRRGGTGKRRLTLRQFRERIEAGKGYDFSDAGSCSCFDSEETEVSACA